MIASVAAYVAALVAFAVVDGAWLTFAVDRFYRPVMADMLAPKPNLPAAVAFYLIYILGVVVLAIQPALKEGAWIRALLTGGMVGLVAYATYDLTNQATLKAWSTRLSLMDMAWGTLATAAAATAGYFAARLAARLFASGGA